VGNLRTRLALVVVAGLVVSTGLTVTAGSGGALVPSTPGDLFDAAPDSVDCGPTSASIVFHADTGRILVAGPANSVVTLSADAGDMGQSPSPFNDPDSGSVYWTVPYEDLGLRTVTWTRRDMSDGTFFGSGTFTVDLTGLCGELATTTTTTAVPTPTTAAPAPDPSTTVATGAVAAPTPPAAARPASAVATEASLTG
jgi:hypothetical protein